MAQLDDSGVVVNVIVVNDDWSAEGFVEYTDDNPAYIGGTYANGRFIAPKPSDDATLDESTGMWIMPANFIDSNSIIADSIGGDSLGA